MKASDACTTINLLLLCLFSPFPTSALSIEECSDTLSCHHGGQCRSWSSEGEEAQEYCFCTDTAEGRFVGLSCDLPAPSDPNDWCNPYGDFCLNGGECMEQTPLDNRVCNCPEGYTGRYCDLEVDSPQIQAHITDEDHNKLTVEDSCALSCLNGGTCEFGHRPPTFAETSNDPTLTAENVTVNYQHCVCPDGFFGPTCENEVTICGYAEDENPAHVCHNGARCVDTNVLFEVMSSSLLKSLPPYMCDCSSAPSEDGTIYTGKYCELANVHFCDNLDNNVDSRSFCSNDSLCTIKGSDGGGHTIWGCLCKHGYEGKHCESIKDSQHNNLIPGTVPASSPSPIVVPFNETCQNTKCENGGECYFGIKDTSTTMLGHFLQRPGLEHIIGDGSGPIKGANDDYEHCQCPAGYTGVHCETQFTVCPSGNHMCFHGSACIGNEDKCSCNEEDDGSALGGLYCQYQATTNCGEDWCFNNGECEDGTSCNCSEGWHGPFCTVSNAATNVDEEDFLSTTSVFRDESNVQNSSSYLNSNLIAIGGAVAVVGIVIGIVVVLLEKRRHYAGESWQDSISSVDNHADALGNGRKLVPPITAFQQGMNRRDHNSGLAAASRNSLNAKKLNKEELTVVELI